MIKVKKVDGERRVHRVWFATPWKDGAGRTIHAGDTVGPPAPVTVKAPLLCAVAVSPSTAVTISSVANGSPVELRGKGSDQEPLMVSLDDKQAQLLALAGWVVTEPPGLPCEFEGLGEAKEALEAARRALNYLPEDCLGFAGGPPDVSWPIRNELLAKITKALEGIS